MCIESKRLPEKGRNYVFTLQGKKEEGKKNPHKIACELIPSISGWIFIHTGTSTAPSEPPTLYRMPGRAAPLFANQDFSSLATAGDQHRNTELMAFMALQRLSLPSSSSLTAARGWCQTLGQIFPGFLPAWGHRKSHKPPPPPLRSRFLAPLKLSSALQPLSLSSAQPSIPSSLPHVYLH